MPGRRIALYFCWDWPTEASVPLERLDNRYPAVFELRRALWPRAEGLKNIGDQGIGGFLEGVVLSDFEQFRAHCRDLTGNEVSVFHRHDKDGTSRQLGDWLANYDTLIVISLDHVSTGQRADDEEIGAFRAFLAVEANAAFVCMHHDVGTTSDPAAEQDHHRDRLVPGQQRIGGFGRSIVAGLGLDIENRFGLSPARAPDGQPAALEIADGLEDHEILKGVRTFNLHPHLPDFQVGSSSIDKVQVMARQRIANDAPPHPGLTNGDRLFNALIGALPAAGLGQLYLCDATLWSSAFGGDAALKQFWTNVCQMGQGGSGAAA